MSMHVEVEQKNCIKLCFQERLLELFHDNRCTTNMSNRPCSHVPGPSKFSDTQVGTGPQG